MSKVAWAQVSRAGWDLNRGQCSQHQSPGKGGCTLPGRATFLPSTTGGCAFKAKALLQENHPQTQ